MDMNVYCLDVIARERLHELRAAAARQSLVAGARSRPPLRVVLGLALMRLGALAAGTPRIAVS